MSTSTAMQDFNSKLRVFHLFNGIFGVWILAQIIFYAVLTVQISCSEMKNLFIVWIFSYVYEIIIPIICIAAVIKMRFFNFTNVLITIAMIYKIAVVVTVLSVAWKHVGLCYLPYSSRVIIIVTNCIEICCLIIEMIMIFRVKHYHREVLIKKMINTKTFAES